METFSEKESNFLPLTDIRVLGAWIVMFLSSSLGLRINIWIAKLTFAEVTCKGVKGPKEVQKSSIAGSGQPFVECFRSCFFQSMVLKFFDMYLIK